MNAKPRFKIGDTVTWKSFTGCFGDFHAAVPGLIVKSIQLVNPSFPDRSTSLPPYFRLFAEQPENIPVKHGQVHSVEGAERFFELGVE